MASNFDFLKKIDKELYSIVQDGEKLFRDEYFNQSIVQFRIYAEMLAKKISNYSNSEFTFDTILNNLKDKIQTEREKEFIEDLFFIKKEGNKCAHGEDATPDVALEVIKRAFEAGINYAYAKKKDENIDKLIFDETLLITQKPKQEVKLIDKYLKRAQEEVEELSKEEFLNKKQGEFNSQVDKSLDENNIKNKTYVKNLNQYKSKKKKKELTPTQEKIKSQIKNAKKNLNENVNNISKKVTKKNKAKKKKQKSKNNKQSNLTLFLIFCAIALYFLSKMIFVN